MKHISIFLKSTMFILSLAILSGCFSGKKTTSQAKGFKVDEYVVYDNDNLRDPVTKLTWTFYKYNTTYYRYKMENIGSIYRLPTIDELTVFLEKIGYQLGKKKDKGNIKMVNWFENDCDFLSVSSVQSTEGEILYEVVWWNATSNQISHETVTGGDLVTVLLIREN